MKRSALYAAALVAAFAPQRAAAQSADTPHNAAELARSFATPRMKACINWFDALYPPNSRLLTYGETVSVTIDGMTCARSDMMPINPERTASTETTVCEFVVGGGISNGQLHYRPLSLSQLTQGAYLSVTAPVIDTQYDGGMAVTAFGTARNFPQPLFDQENASGSAAYSFTRDGLATGTAYKVTRRAGGGFGEDDNRPQPMPGFAGPTLPDFNRMLRRMDKASGACLPRDPVS